jgi:hypothetical protein
MPEAKLSPPLQTALDAINRATNGITNEQLTWHPEGKWSSAEILEHLLLAYARTSERMRTLLKEDKPDVRSRTFREWVGRLIVLKLGRIPPGRKAPEAVAPKGMLPQEAMASIRKHLVELDGVIDECERRFGGRKNVLVHAVLGPLSMPEWRRFHSVHTQHHMRQIESLRQKMKMTETVPANKAGTS